MARRLNAGPFVFAIETPIEPSPDGSAIIAGSRSDDIKFHIKCGGSDVPNSEGDDAEEDEEDMGDSEEDDLIEQSDDDASEWGTDLELEEYSGETIVKESTQFPRAKDEVDKKTEKQLESHDGLGESDDEKQVASDGKLPGKNQFLKSDHVRQLYHSGEEDDNIDLHEHNESIAQTTFLVKSSIVYSTHEGENIDINSHARGKENTCLKSDRGKREGENTSDHDTR
ncbi:hypothetical protein L2E82_25522 [Cichorium intybus]|uniref:Uncharacterized protein n=1 Tax=Cichorium intybus TaxID=13427 RepID=A0ACB9E4H3_CICIN|nr:hypothetical protein L2E82_25522 [Cichorium intybus]